MKATRRQSDRKYNSVWHIMSQEGNETMKSWQEFQYWSCYRMAQNHSTIASQNFTLTQPLMSQWLDI